MQKLAQVEKDKKETKQFVVKVAYADYPITYFAYYKVNKPEIW